MTEIFDDIRKLYTFQNPCNELARFIEFFSETSLEAMSEHIQSEAFSVKLFPSYTPTIWINLGAPYYLKNGEKLNKIEAQTDVLLLRNTIVERINLPTDHIFTIKFYPSAFEALFGVSQSKIGDKLVDVNEIIEASVIKKMKQAASFSDRISIIEAFFLEKLSKNAQKPFPFICINGAIDNYFQSGLAAKNKGIANDLYISEKSLYRYFKQAIGTNPKNYFATVRARTALTAYNLDKKTFSPYDFGYYDHGHFSKDVVRFTGQSLSTYSKINDDDSKNR
jgi:AraC-like DNA-binding protein